MELQDNIHMDELLDEAHMRYLTFLTDHQLFSVPITKVVQITKMPKQLKIRLLKNNDKET